MAKFVWGGGGVGGEGAHRPRHKEPATPMQVPKCKAVSICNCSKCKKMHVLGQNPSLYHKCIQQQNGKKAIHTKRNTPAKMGLQKLSVVLVKKNNAMSRRQHAMSQMNVKCHRIRTVENQVEEQ